MKIIKKIGKIVLILLVIIVVAYISIYYYSIWKMEKQIAYLTSPETNRELAQLFTATVGKIDSINNDSISIIRQDNQKLETYNIDESTEILKTNGNGNPMISATRDELKKNTVVSVVIPKGNIKLVIVKAIDILTGVEL
ncbi:MAG: hypothetical protein WC589_20640 [Sphingobacterium sp.]